MRKNSPHMFISKHHKALAKVIGKVNWQDSQDEKLGTLTPREHFIEALILMFEADNPEFRRHTFIDAIGKALGLSDEDIDVMCEFCGKEWGH